MAMSFDERAANPCIGAERADLVLAGCAILDAIRRAFPCPRLRVADRGLREGMLVEMMREDRVWEKLIDHGAPQGPETPHAVVADLARTPAQRSLCGARQARRLSLARRL